ncbi:hypothetical protein [Paucidesulfovibrio gracilis]|nr:hypothetical protein [Paucidesulfovibrio gracilis]
MRSLIKDDILVKAGPMLSMVGNWKMYLAEPEDETDYDVFKASEESGKPLGGETFVEKLEVLLGRPLKPKKRGRKKKGDR